MRQCADGVVAGIAAGEFEREVLADIARFHGLGGERRGDVEHDHLEAARRRFAAGVADANAEIASGSVGVAVEALPDDGPAVGIDARAARCEIERVAEDFALINIAADGRDAEGLAFEERDVSDLGKAGRIIDRVHGQVDGEFDGVALAVAGAVAETVRTVEVGSRRVDEVAVVLELQAAIGRAADQDRAQYVTVAIAIVVEDIAGKRLVFVAA
jgi:hypothetical protein